MIPIRDDNPQINIPYVTYLIIGLNVIAWLALQGFGIEPDLTESVCRLGLIPGDLLDTVDSLRIPEGYPCPIDNQSNWLTLLTSMFMHGSWLHIIGKWKELRLEIALHGDWISPLHALSAKSQRASTVAISWMLIRSSQALAKTSR